MKKTTLRITVLLCAAALLFAGCNTQTDPPQTTEALTDIVTSPACIGNDEALEIAKMEALRSEPNGIFTDIAVTLSSEEDKTFYAISFESENVIYTYSIDAFSGKVLRAKRKGKPQPFALPEVLPSTPAESTAN